MGGLLLGPGGQVAMRLVENNPSRGFASAARGPGSGPVGSPSASLGWSRGTAAGIGRRRDSTRTCAATGSSRPDRARDERDPLHLGPQSQSMEHVALAPRVEHLRRVQVLVERDFVNPKWDCNLKLCDARVTSACGSPATCPTERVEVPTDVRSRPRAAIRWSTVAVATSLHRPILRCR